MRDDNLICKQTGLDPAVDFGAHSHVIHWTSWFCQRLECITSAPLSSFLGVSGGEGIATGEHTQFHFICWFPARSTQGCLVFSIVWFPLFGSSETTSRVGYIFVHTVQPYTVYKRSGLMLHLWTRMSWVDQRCSLETLCFGLFITARTHSQSHPGGPLTLWTVRVQSWSVTKRVAPAASWEELAVIHAECVSGDWVTLPREGKAGSTHCTHCWNRRHLTYPRQVCSVCGGACVCVCLYMKEHLHICMHVCISLLVFTYDINRRVFMHLCLAMSSCVHVRELHVCASLCVSTCGYASGQTLPTPSLEPKHI